MTEPDEALLWARWAMRGYNRPSDVAIPLTAPLRIDGRRLSGVEAHNLTEALAVAYRAGAAASAEREEELEARVAELEAALAKANEPQWFFLDTGVPYPSLYEAVVDPDLLAFREWAAAQGLDPGPDVLLRDTYLAGARMATERERERADMPMRMSKELAHRFRTFLHFLTEDIRAQFGMQCELDKLFAKDVEAEIAKYRGEA